jgi:SlyX protein
MSDNPTAPAQLEARITELEIKLSYTEDLLDTLNSMVARQQQDMDWLLREVSRLRQLGGEQSTGTPRNLRDELPPHY